MPAVRHHLEWLSLIEVAGPFFSVPVLQRAFPQGLDAPDPELAATLRRAYEEWLDNHGGGRPDPAIHRAWVRYVLAEALGYGEALVEGPALPPSLRVAIPEQGETLRPDLALYRGRPEEPARLLIAVVPRGQSLEGPLVGARWKASPATRMTELLRGTDVPLGLATDGERWMLVSAPRGETAGFATWFADLWFEEPITLRAFRSLLSLQRFYGVPDEETPEALLRESLTQQQEVTDQLGRQVRAAVAVLVGTLDRIDRDRGGALLAGIAEPRLYEAALTVMMRLVFLFSAEERGLLRLGDPLYDANYAVSTIGGQLRAAADQAGEEVLERRHDAWSRLLATFRAVHGGLRHDLLQLPAYGGDLFDPDRFPFLEGRALGTSWRDAGAGQPLPVHNRAVLHLLEALQVLRVRGPGGGPVEPRRLSFRALDVEQIGHVYEGLLDHTARRATEPMLGLTGKGDPDVPLAQLETLRGQGEARLLAFLAEETGRSRAALAAAMAAAPDLAETAALRAACDNDEALLARVRPFAGLLRDDSFARPLVIPAGAVSVTAGADRRSTGTHYTPRSLTEPIVRHTLDPLVYQGPAEGLPPAEWTLKPAAALLRLTVCDMAMGSGAFLVQACRYLAERLVEAWDAAEQAASGRVVVTPEGALSTGAPTEQPLPRDPEERLAAARRIVADHCLYGVDKNPLAVEMAKLSLWLVTLQKDRPFTFLDHRLRCGDSLLGIDLAQLERWSLDRTEDATLRHVQPWVRAALQRSLALRRRIAQTTVASAHDAEEKARLLKQAEEATELVRLGADLLAAAALDANPKGRELLRERLLHAYETEALANAEHERQPFTPAHRAQGTEARERLRREADELLGQHRPFHWSLEFPEIVLPPDVRGERIDPRQRLDTADFLAMAEAPFRPGFAAIIGNPPFMGGQKITGALGTGYRDYLVAHLAGGQRGSADLCAYFFLRARQLTQADGGLGLLATNTIAQGDTREVGLEQLAADGTAITRAEPSRKWPGEASLEVAHLWLRRGDWRGPYVLDEQPVAGITPYLTVPSRAQGKPHRLAANAGKSFQGSIVLGMGFVLEPEEAQALIAKDSRNRDVLFPYLNGEDLNSRPDQSPSRWVINFRDWPLERAETYPDCMRIVREKVKPERDKNKYSQSARERWWLYERARPELYDAIAGLERVIAIAATSRTLAFAYADPRVVFSHAVYVFAMGTFPHFALLQSAVHESWAREYASSMKGDLRYTPTDVFDTFAFPESLADLEGISRNYVVQRASICRETDEGLTKLYNRFHNLDEASADIAWLRELHVELDRAVADAYGWSDLDLGHDFHQTKQGLRFTISEAARREVLDRLLLLNHERYAAEVAQGLHDHGNGKARAARKRQTRSGEQRALAGLD